MGESLVFAQPPLNADPPKIQVAVLLDTSGSMGGLINQARAQLWRMVTEFSKASHGGLRPQLEVALFKYGNDGLRASEGCTRRIVPFTEDLDQVSKELFALRTNGGREFCGWVIDQAARSLAWSASNHDLHCLFIAGNEPAIAAVVHSASRLLAKSRRRPQRAQDRPRSQR